MSWCKRTNYCDYCEIENCELRGEINFCEDCADYESCTIPSSCAAGHDVECNNGFEPKSWFEDVYEDEKNIWQVDRWGGINNAEIQCQKF